jgi:hypothetical protein
MIASACTGPDKRVWAQVALDIGSDDLAGNAFAGHEPLIHSRHNVSMEKSDEGKIRKERRH